MMGVFVYGCVDELVIRLEILVMKQDFMRVRGI